MCQDWPTRLRQVKSQWVHQFCEAGFAPSCGPHYQSTLGRRLHGLKLFEYSRSKPKTELRVSLWIGEKKIESSRIENSCKSPPSQGTSKSNRQPVSVRGP
ncbi:unnamed protein product [Protopolystoma xenopodis]|uniref:Uncharacterized protein n=1 Tax=Protopolystoma xenopodis TaxID=117903 RepID=A0A3S5CN49_9PLAT|nr:unnamed protein product [Protopolystoma xenopodis]